MKLLKVVLDAFFPKHCICCGDIIENDDYLCDYCYQMMEPYDFLKRCNVCGKLLDNCDCKSNVFHFNHCISAFSNKGLAQKAMYALKFNNKYKNASFFATRMCLAVQSQYRDVKFDYICSVPTTRIKKTKRGYNQTEAIAEKMATILKVPFERNILKCNRNGKSQHRLTWEERFVNVKGLYGYRYKSPGKSVLLIDDIKTTGATLDECARVLLQAGAHTVYCVTALISEKS